MLIPVRPADVITSLKFAEYKKIQSSSERLQLFLKVLPVWVREIPLFTVVY